MPLSTAPLLLFLDAEFHRQPGGQLDLISLALAGEVGDSLDWYAESTPDELRTLPGIEGNAFVQAEVLPQLGRVPGRALPRLDMAADLAAWLDALGKPPRQIHIQYDYSADYELLEQLLASAPALPRCELLPVHVGYLLEDPDGEAAAQASWRVSALSRKLSRHHALADALALKSRFEAVHGR